MNRNNRIGLFILILVLVSLPAFAEYDGAHVRRVMQENVQLMGKIGRAVEAQDFMAAAESLMKLATGMNSLKKYEPYRGSKADWDKTYDDFANAAYRGIGACGNRDIAGLKAAFNELKSLNSRGHGAHK